MGKPIHTYVFIGDDQRAWNYASRPDVTIIVPEKGQSIGRTMRQICPPANIVVQCHGTTDGRFAWHGAMDATKSTVRYADFMKGLPRSGIFSVTIDGCFGSSALVEKVLRHAPPGTIVQSSTGAASEGINATSWKFGKESEGLTQPIDLLLEALDNFNPTKYQRFIEYSNRVHKTNYNVDPMRTVPHMLGIGGVPPVIINLLDEGKAMGKRVLDAAAWQRAIRRVQARFDTDSFRDGKAGPVQLGNSGTLGDAHEAALDASIEQMAVKLTIGHAPKTADEKRIYCALVATYLDESGTLERHVEAQPHYVPFYKQDAFGRPITDSAKMLQQFPYRPRLPGPYFIAHPSITDEERAYLVSVAHTLKNNPELPRIFAALQQVFVQTKDNDTFAKMGVLDATLRAQGVHTKSWVR